MLGAGISLATGKPVVTTVTRNGSAWQAGLNVHDEIIGMNGYRTTDDLNKTIPSLAVGDVLELVVNRSGQLMIIPVTLLKNQSIRYRAEMSPNATEAQKKNYQKWTNPK